MTKSNSKINERYDIMMEKQRLRDQKIQLLAAAQKEKDIENITFKPKIN